MVCDFDSNIKYPSIWLKNRSKILEIELQRTSSYKLVRNSLFFVCSSSSKIYGGSSSELLGLKSVDLLLIYGLLKFLETFELDSSKI